MRVLEARLTDGATDSTAPAQRRHARSSADGCARPSRRSPWHKPGDRGSADARDVARNSSVDRETDATEMQDSPCEDGPAALPRGSGAARRLALALDEAGLLAPGADSSSSGRVRLTHASRTGNLRPEKRAVSEERLQWERRCAHEVERKLGLLEEAHDKEARDIVCQEVLDDLTGELDDHALVCLEAPRGSRFYEILAEHYDDDENHADAERLLALCQGQWVSVLVPPIYALLLHRWLLTRPDAGGRDDRARNAHIMLLAARDLMRGDADGGASKFLPLFRFLNDSVVFDDEARASLPRQSVLEACAVVAGMSPYYLGPNYVRYNFRNFPAPPGSDKRTPSRVRGVPGGFQAVGGWAKAAAGPRTGPELFMQQVSRTLCAMQAEHALVTCLRRLRALKGVPELRGIGTMVSLEFQSVLYTLTQEGGPRYPTRAVRHAADAALDALFPMGASSRRAARLFFWLMHPVDVARGAWTQAGAAAAAVAGAVVRLSTALPFSDAPALLPAPPLHEGASMPSEDVPVDGEPAGSTDAEDVDVPEGADGAAREAEPTGLVGRVRCAVGGAAGAAERRVMGWVSWLQERSVDPRRA
ncbi:unnamed protein product [Pedinophyceae sp. YPF-701]|nr:unnamed protein product [Pedinophyceae sp. YPF-701]